MPFIFAHFIRLLTLLFVSSFVVISVSATTTNTEDLLLVQSDEEILPQVRKVSIQGNDNYPNLIIRQIIGTKAPGTFRKMQFWRKTGFEFSENEVRRDVIRIERFYQRRGFYEVNVTYDIEIGNKPHYREVTFLIDEGPETIVNEVIVNLLEEDQERLYEIINSREYQRALSRNPLREGRRYEIIRHADIESAITSTLKNRGYAFTEVRVRGERDSLNHTAILEIDIDPGPQAIFGSIRIEGERSVPKSVVERQSGIKTGELFSLRDMNQAQQNIFRHPLFRFVTLSVTNEEPSEEVDLLIRVREFPLRSIELGAGLGSEEIVRGRVSWTHRNPFGNGHRFNVSARASFIEQRGNLGYLIPGFLTPRSNINISPFGQRLNEQNFLLNRAGVQNNFSYYYSREFVGTIGYEFAYNNLRLKDDKVLRDSSRVYNVSSLQISALYNESRGDVGRGWAFRPYIEISGFLNTGSIVYQKVSLDARRFINLGNLTQIALRTDTGFLFSNDPFDVPANIRYYSGGPNSVRGWTRSQLGPQRAVINNDGEFSRYLPTGGQAHMMFNAEIRQDIPLFNDGLQIAAFLDGGQVFLETTDIDFNQIQYAAGFGVRFMTAIGPIRFDFGYKLNPNDQDLNIFEGVDHGGANRWAIHFSIGQAF